MKSVVRALTPKFLWEPGKRVYYRLLAQKYRRTGRPYKPAETSKAKQRREREDYFAKYCHGKGLDIGFGGDPITSAAQGFDYEHGNAQLLDGLEDESFDFVYSSHTLEHMVDPAEALTNWWRVLKPGGLLLLYLPHRDLYEKKKTLPSNWNNDHKFFFLPERDEEPHTLGVLPLLIRTLNELDLVVLKVCDDGHTITDPKVHSDGEYSIEAIVRKRV